MSHKNGRVAASFTLMLIALLLVVSSFMFRDLLDIPRKLEATSSVDKRFTLALRRLLRFALGVSAATGRKKINQRNVVVPQLRWEIFVP